MTGVSKLPFPDRQELKAFLDEKSDRFNNHEFIGPDPVSIPHKFSLKQDIEISGFLTATIAWGRRDLILRSANNLMDLMGSSPYDFVMTADQNQIGRLKNFVYRTFNGIDCVTFILCLRNFYARYESPEDIFVAAIDSGGDVKEGLASFREKFFFGETPLRSGKHFANVNSGAAGKRLNMYLRWMVRKDNRGVDFGIWERIPQAGLFIPLDLHSGNTARKLGMLTRKQNDWKAVDELTSVLREFDPTDPVRYDFALFGLGVNEEF